MALCVGCEYCIYCVRMVYPRLNERNAVETIERQLEKFELWNCYNFSRGRAERHLARRGAHAWRASAVAAADEMLVLMPRLYCHICC